MKVLFDCILTQRPEACSTNAQFITLAEKLLKERDDVFIYWPVAMDLYGTDQMECYPKSDRIKYINVHQSKDRMREYNRLLPDMYRLLTFDGDCWDWDTLVTVRSQMVPLMRVIALSPRQVNRRDWSKRIVIIEDMMILSKKPTVVQSNEDVQDRLTIEGYFAADVVLMPAYHQKAWVREVARKHFSAARLKELESKIKEVSHLSLPEYKLKRPEYMYHSGRKMNVAFVGRLERTNARLASINKMLASQFIYNGSNVHPFICTISPDGSPGENHIDLDAIEVRHPKRLEFWSIAEKEMDLAVFFHIDVELNMSMLEPLTFGVPMIVKRAPWSEALMGADYPFFVNTDTEGYALINAFAEDYQKHYAVFSEWYKQWFIPTYTKRTQEDGLYKHLMEWITKPVEGMDKMLGTSAEDNEIVRLLAEHGGDEFFMFDLLKELGKTHIRTLADKMNCAPEARGLIWLTPWNEFRLALKAFYGYDDAGVEPGHLKKVK